MTPARGVNGPVWLLAIGHTLTYAALYYAFAALLPDLEVETGWSKAQLAAGPTLAFLITAVLTPFTGRLVDRGWGGELLIWMPMLGAAALVGLSFAHTPLAWLGLWAIIGVAQAGSFYETCFAFLTRRLGDGARAAITKVTLVAGFASTLSFPLGHALGRAFGGQGALAAFALLIVLGSVPVNMVGVAQLRRLQGVSTMRPEAEPGALAAALRKPAFWAMAAIFGLTYVTHSVLITYSLVLFEDRGAPEAMAVLAASCIGPAQVAGRLALLVSEARVGNARATVWSLGAIVLASALLWAAGAAPMLIFGFAVMQGVGIGLCSILRPVLLSQLLGRRGFGAISGAVAVAPILGTAVGPVFGAALLAQGGFVAVYAACLAMSLAGLALGIWLLWGRV